MYCKMLLVLFRTKSAHSKYYFCFQNKFDIAIQNTVCKPKIGFNILDKVAVLQYDLKDKSERKWIYGNQTLVAAERLLDCRNK